MVLKPERALRPCRAGKAMEIGIVTCTAADQISGSRQLYLCIGAPDFRFFVYLIRNTEIHTLHLPIKVGAWAL